MDESARARRGLARVGGSRPAGRGEDRRLNDVSRNIACIVLAAGGSTRFGSRKQLHNLGDESLVHRAVRAAVECGTTPVVLVTGADADTIRHSVLDFDSIVIAGNEQWETGLASSIAAGLRALDSHSPDGILITVADQPLVDAACLRRLIESFDADHRIVASSYNGTVGVPAIFGAEHIVHLATLKGDRGAGSWIRARLESVTVIPMPEAAVDIDTPADLDRISHA